VIAEASPSSLVAWESFYVIVGSSAGALTGLQFVVITLIANSPRRATSGQIEAYGTPTVAHFCVVLLISAILSAPWQSLGGVAVLLGITGIWGIAYTWVVLNRARRVTAYSPVLEDWIFHCVLPFLSYLVLLAAAFTLRAYPATALFMVGIMAVLLLFVGIHNAWDAVTFIVTEQLNKPDKSTSD
jgi:hypothetical protein